MIEPHREESGTEELYVVVRGAARFTLGDETFDAPAGTLVHALPGTFRSATAAEAGTIVLACGAEAGKAFTPSGWEDFYVAFALQRDGETERARATMQEALAREPDAWQGQYNAACFEALAGETDAALRPPAARSRPEPRRCRVRRRRRRPRVAARRIPRFTELSR